MASQSTNSWAIRPTCLPASLLLNFNPLFWPVSLPPPLPFNSCVTVHPDARTAAGGRGREPQWRRRLSTAAAVYKFSPIVEGGGERERGLSFFRAISPLLSPICVSFPRNRRRLSNVKGAKEEGRDSPFECSISSLREVPGQ